MSRELRIVLIVFGSIVGLIALAVLALVLLLPQFARRVVATQRDPAAMARTAAKIARFDLPRGYRFASAVDVLFATVVVVVPTGPKPAFFIQLQSVNVPRPSSDAETRSALLTGLASGLRTTSQCRPFEKTGVDHAIVRGRPIELDVFTCRSGTRELRAEAGAFAAESPNAIVMAVGPRDRFDRNALLALLRSVR